LPENESSSASSRMLAEARQAPAAAEQLLRENAAEVASLAQFLRKRPPTFVQTIARGSSDHAALYGKYLFETRLGWVTASAAPSVVTVYGARPNVKGALVLALSQSGASTYLVESLTAARRAGALTVALVNVEDSPLARAAEVVLPLHAGEEKSVAATKSYLAMLVAQAQLVALAEEADDLEQALPGLPEQMALNAAADWSEGQALFRPASDAYVVGRGYAYAVASELALKLKETSAMHAEAFSAAELLHGPVAIVGPGYPILALAPYDRPYPQVIELLAVLKQKGAELAVASSEPEALALADAPLPLAGRYHPVLDTVLIAQAFYPFAEALSRARGYNPDHPRNLHKVTRTR
jgi:glucosamine--fructose-6-phosphate aminotransferase (isomerizing)